MISWRYATAKENEMIRGSCHCGSIHWEFDGVPESTTACNCTACRRIGALWAYDWDNEGIRIRAVPGMLAGYVRPNGDLAFHFCKSCGNTTHWRGLAPSENGKTRIAVNLRLSEHPEEVAKIPVRHFDGLDSWSDLPEDGKCVADLWF
jgi:hypothetical protein